MNAKGLSLVPPDPDGPMSFDEANEEFRERWTGAREAYADLMQAAGALAHPLYIQTGSVPPARIIDAAYQAERVAEAARELAAQLAAAQDVANRANKREGR